MAKDIFVSYTTPDLAVANEVVAFFEKQGVDCFIAPRDVDPGKPYAANLMQAIDNARVIILIATAAINDSDHVLNEIEAIVHKKKPLWYSWGPQPFPWCQRVGAALPFSADRAKPPSSACRNRRVLGRGRLRCVVFC